MLGFQSSRVVLSHARALSSSSQTNSKRVALRALYKQVLRHARVFPSKGRDELVENVRAEFRQNATATDPTFIDQEITRAKEGLRDLQAYTGMVSGRGDWSIQLKETPLPQQPLPDEQKSE